MPYGGIGDRLTGIVELLHNGIVILGRRTFPVVVPVRPKRIKNVLYAVHKDSLREVYILRLLTFCATVVACFLTVVVASAASGGSAAASPAYFETRVRPILAAKCFACHTNARMGKLRLDNPIDIMEGGSRGRVIVPGDPDRSLLIAAVRHTDPQLKMPMASPKLAPAEIAALVAWVKAGAVMPAGSRPSAVAAR